jgi:hypothetical protein
VRLHVSSNHGARCFAHRLGFRFWCDRFLWLFITPAAYASAIRNASTFVVRSSLSSLYALVMLLNAAANASVDVCAFQIFALWLCSATQFPLIQ